MNIEGPKAEADVAKQIISLSTGAVAFTVTFLEKFKVPSDSAAAATENVAGKTAPLVLSTGIYLSWLLFGLTIAFALWYLMTLNGTIVAMGRKENGFALTTAQERAAKGGVEHTKLPGVLMVLTFLLAVIALIWGGIVR